MRTVHFAAGLIAGTLGTIAFMLSCGGGGTKLADANNDGSNDATMCDCAVAEPPIAPRVMEAKKDLVIPANTPSAGQSVVCPGVSGGIVLSGGCSGNINDDITLRESFPGPSGWGCTWSNNSNHEVTVTAIVNCLVPAK